MHIYCTYTSYFILLTSYTVNLERFAGLNICSFNPIKYFANTFVVPWPAVFIIYISIHEKTFVVLQKIMKV